MSDESKKVDDRLLTQQLLFTIKPGAGIRDIESFIDIKSFINKVDLVSLTESYRLIEGDRHINLSPEEDKLATQEFDDIMEQIKLSTVRIDKDQEEIDRLRQETRVTIENLTALIK